MKVNWLTFRHFYFLLIVWFCVCTSSQTAGDWLSPTQSHASQQSTLYERLGGYDAISSIIDGFLVKMWADPQVGRYFVGMGTDTREQLRQKNKLLMCKNTGGPCKVINRSIKLSHVGLGITENDWHIAVAHLTDTLTTLKIKKQEQQDLLQLISSLKEQIVEKTTP